MVDGCVGLTLLSQKVIRGTSGDVWFTTAGSRVEHQEIVIHLFIHLHYTCLVAAAVTVIGRRENRHYLFLVAPIVARHDELMGTCHCFETIFLNELVRDVLPECVPCATW